MNQPSALAPTRPTVAASSMWAMPATRVANTRGAMIILISRRKTSVMIERLEATSLACSGLAYWFTPQPTATPSTMAPTMKAVNRRFMGDPLAKLLGGLCRRDIAGRPSRHAPRLETWVAVR